jgi:TolB-like protein/Tfp pilus assembly protein PilF
MTFLSELKRRKVFRVAVVYAATAFAVLQGADIILPNLGVPGWAMGFLVVLVLLGFPIALVLTWALEVTPDGVKRTGAAPNEAVEGTPSLLGTRTLVVGGLLVAVGVGLSAGWVLKPGAGAGPLAEAESAGAVDVPASIAVLPFADLSPERDQEWFSDGLAEEILNLLASVRDLSVASRTSAFSFKGSPAPIPEIGEQLGVRYVLEGSVRKADDRIRVTAQLIDVRTDRHLWSQNYDRTLADVFAVQDEISAAIGEALRVQLLGRDGEVVTATEIAPDLYEKFLQSRFLIRQRSQAALARATALLEEVVEGEPGYAPGLAQLAEALLVSAGGVIDSGEFERRLDRILELVDRALSIDPRLAAAFAVRGNVAMTRNEYVGALHDFQRAIELDPDDPRSHHWLGMLYSESGHLDLGERAIAKSLRLDPENANAEGYRADLLATRGRWDDAMASARRVTELGNPYGHVTGALFLLGVDPGALQHAESELRLALAKGAHPHQVPLKAIAFASGDTAALASLSDDVRANRMWLYVATTAILALERPDALLTLLEWDDYLFDRLSALVWAADQAALRRDPRFVEFLRRQGVTDLWREIGSPPDCRADGDTWRCGLTGEAAN